MTCYTSSLIHTYTITTIWFNPFWQHFDNISNTFRILRCIIFICLALPTHHVTHHRFFSPLNCYPPVLQCSVISYFLSHSLSCHPNHFISSCHSAYSFFPFAFNPTFLPSCFLYQFFLYSYLFKAAFLKLKCNNNNNNFIHLLISPLYMLRHVLHHRHLIVKSGRLNALLASRKSTYKCQISTVSNDSDWLKWSKARACYRLPREAKINIWHPVLLILFLVFPINILLWWVA
jgi:hypothetical protein